MGISRDSRHKRSATGAKRAQFRKKRKFELGRQAANTKIGPKRIHSVRTRGGNQKFRALRIETGNFSWGSEGISRKTRIAGVVYHPSNNELVRTNTLTKSAVVQIDATPFRQWYENHYGATLGKRRLLTLLKLPMLRDLEKSKENWLLDPVLLPLNLLLTLNSVLVDYTLLSLLDQVNLVDVMVTSWKVKN